MGSLHVTGTVSLNGAPATSEQSIYANDVVHTGPDGAAVLTLPGTGMMTIEASTEVAFPPGQYLATLRQGTVELRSSNAGKNVEIEFGKLVMYLPFFESESAGTVTLAADLTGRVECHEGQVGVSTVEVNAAVFLKPGQSVSTTADGKIGQAEPPASGQSASQPATSTTNPAGKSHRIYIVFGTAAAAGGGVGIALALQHHNTPTSPTAP